MKDRNFPYICTGKQYKIIMTPKIRKFPIGIQDFKDLRKSGYLYVDKTALLYKPVTEGKPYFPSRPRRFGKSLLPSTLACYFEGRKDLFEGLAIEKLETEWTQHPVFYIDMNKESYTDFQSLLSGLDTNLLQATEPTASSNRTNRFKQPNQPLQTTK
jgi:hypothetical protein